MSVGIGLIEIVVLLVVCTLAIAALRKPSWLTLLVVPFGLLLLLGIGTVTWSVAVPRQVSYQAVEPVERLLDQQDWGIDETGPFRVSSSQIEHAGSVMHNLDRSRQVFATHPPRWAIVVPLLGVAACMTVLILSHKWIAQHAYVVLPVLGIGLAGVLAAGVLFGSYFLVDARVATYEPAFRDRGLQQRRMIANSRQRITSNVSHETTAADAQDAVKQEDAPADSGAADTAVGSLAPAGGATEAPRSAPTPELPEWARGESVDWRGLLDGAHQNPVVLVSDEWSSVQESEIQIEAMAARALQQQLQSEHGSSFRWEPSKDFIHQSGAIQQRFVEQTSLKVGEFETPMYRSYWQVGATASVSSLAEKEWKAAAVEERLTMLGAGAAVLTLLFAGGAAGLRFDSATGGRYRRRMAASAVAVGALAAGTAALFVA